LLIWLLLVASFFSSWILTSLLRKYAIGRRLVDAPGKRRSHSGIVPRGGGVAIAVTFSCAIAFLAAFGRLDPAVAAGFLGSSGLITILGFVDDHRDLGVARRLLVQFVAAGWLMYWLVGDSYAALGEVFPILPQGLVYVGVLIYVVWLVNLYNFMDGIDGIASIEAIVVSLGAAGMYVASGVSSLQWYLPAMLLAATAGFLPWNFPRASIFLGDSGSGFLGVTLAALSLMAAVASRDLFWAWIILLCLFITDATFTLLRRLLRGEPPHVAHREHAYQFAARRFGGHVPVTVGVAVLNACWILPLAILVGLDRLPIAVGVMAAYIPATCLMLYFRAGAGESGDTHLPV